MLAPAERVVEHRDDHQREQGGYRDAEDERDRDTRSSSVNDEGREQRSPDSDTSANRHDNPRTGRVSDW